MTVLDLFSGSGYYTEMLNSVVGFAKSCFTLKGEAGILGNSEDNHTLAVTDKSIHGNSDRFVFKFIRN